MLVGLEGKFRISDDKSASRNLIYSQPKAHTPSRLLSGRSRIRVVVLNMHAEPFRFIKQAPVEPLMCA